MMPAKTKKELRAEKKALRRAAHLRAMQDHESEESGEENHRRTADPPAYVATNEGEIVAAPTSPPRRAEKRGPGADGDGEVKAAEKKKPQIRGILKKPTLPRGAVARDSVEVSSSSSDTDEEGGGELARKPSLSLESVETGDSAYSEPGMSTATMSATTVSEATSVISAATSSADTVEGSEAAAPAKNASVRGRNGAAGASAVATIDEETSNEGEETADLGSSAWDNAIERKEGEMLEKKLAAVDGSDRSRKIKGSVDGSNRSGKVNRSDRSGKSPGRSGNAMNKEEGREKMDSKRGSKKKSKKSKRDLGEHGGNGEVATAAVIAHADEAVQNWKESSDPIMHGEDGGSKSHTRGALEGDEAEGKREKQKKRLLMLSVCLLLLLVLILGLAFGMRSGGDDGGSNVEEANDVDAKDTGTSTRSPSRSPTTEPTPPGMWIFDTPVDVVDVPSPSARKETVHSVDLVLENMPEGYTLPPEMENSILSFFRDKIDRQLSEDDIELISVFYAENDERSRRLLRSSLIRRRLATISLPLEIRVVGPADISDVHLTYIMEALEDTTDLTEYLKLLDKNAFQDADVSFASDSYEWPTTAPPSLPPTPQPTNDPTPPPIFRSPTASPIENIDGTTPSPITATPTNPPTPPPTPLATTASPTDNPTFKPTWVNSLECTPNNPPPDVQCDGAGMILLEKCSSSDTRAKDAYGHALDMATGPNGIIYGVVGSPRHDTSGSAYLISYDQATTQWKHVVEIVPGGASANGGFEGEEVNRSYDQFGYAVALSSEWIAVSAPFDTASTGRVSVYWLDGVLGGGFNEPDAELLASDGNFLARFGSSLAIDGNTLVIGANKDRGNVGSAYIFQYSDGARAWLEIAKLAPDDVSVDSQGNFGQSVAITPGVVVVGAPMDGTIGRRRSGSVYVYSDTGAFLQKIVPFELLGGDQFGYSVAAQTSTNPLTNAQETRLAIGARMRDDQGIDSGSVYLYVQRDGEGDFVFEEKLTPSEWATGAEMGTSLAMDGDKIIVGARSLNSGGGAFYFQYDGLAWSGRDSVTPQSVGARSGDEVGSAVAMASGVALIGSHSNDEGGQDAGALYSFVVCD